MKFFLIAAVFTICIAVAGVPAKAQEIVVPKKTWDAQQNTAKPLNLRSILRGNSSGQSSLTQGPTSRNPLDLIQEGQELEYSEALLNTADYNAARAAIRMQSVHHHTTEEEATLIMAELAIRAEEQLEAQKARRTEFYLRHDKLDKHAREYLRTKNGRDLRKQFRAEQREKIREEKEKLKVAKRDVKEREKEFREQRREERAEQNAPRTIVPVAKPAEDGQVKPFFYR